MNINEKSINNLLSLHHTLITSQQDPLKKEAQCDLITSTSAFKTCPQEPTIQQSEANIDEKTYNHDNEKCVDPLSDHIYKELIDDVLFGLVVQMHRAAKLDYLSYIEPDTEPDPELEKQYQFYNDADVLGVFSTLNENFKTSTNNSRNGQNTTGLKCECVCPNCDRNLAATRFAPHLEKCMGMGRNSSRVASRRIANYNGDDLDQLIESTGMIPNPKYYIEQAAAMAQYSSNNTTSSKEEAQVSSSNVKTSGNGNNNSSSTNSTTNASSNNEAIHVSSSSSSLIEVDVSSSSSACSLINNNNNNNPYAFNDANSNYVQNMKLPMAKKKRLNNSKSSINFAMSNNESIPQQSSSSQPPPAASHTNLMSALQQTASSNSMFNLKSLSQGSQGMVATNEKFTN